MPAQSWDSVTGSARYRRVARRTLDFCWGLAPNVGGRATGIFVLGMHRSGTSALARIVNLLGMPLGSGRDIEPDHSNPRGYWENVKLTRFQETLLDRVGGSWAAPPALEDGWERSPRLVEMIGRGRRLFHAAYGNAPLWAWKDPRTAITLAFWLRALHLAPLVVVIHRHPLEVSHSLATRSGMPKQDALALWERYNRAILRNAAGLPALVTSYARVVADPAEEAARVAAFLRAAGVEMPADVSREGVRSFVEPSLRHSAHDDEDLAADAEVTPEQRELRAALVSLEGAYGTLPSVDLPPESAGTEALLARRRALPDRGRRGRPDE